MIGQVQINVLKIFHDSVKLSITDPKSTPVYREEILYLRDGDDEINDEDDEASEFDISCDPAAVDAQSPFAISVL